jgi:hypothetical protein
MMVFISYSSHDIAHAIQLTDAFRKMGMAIWIDYEHLKLNEPILPQLETAIQQSTIFCLVDSPRARQSQWVQYELQLQFQMENMLIVYPVFSVVELCAFSFVHRVVRRVEKGRLTSY